MQIDRNVYSLDSIKKAAYRYIDKFAIDIRQEQNFYECELSFKNSVSEEGARFYIDEFKKELLDQDLREKIKIETEPVRNLILAHAFSKTGFVSDE